MIDFLRNEITWIKDLITLFFAATGMIIGILTYNRAKHTLFQPIRQETIKRQSKTLSDLLNYIRGNNTEFESQLDYLYIVEINIMKHLEDFGFIFKENEKYIEQMETDISGWIPCGNSKILKDVEIIRTFEQSSNKSLTDISKEKYELLKQGKINIDKIYLTKNHKKFMEQSSIFINDPFLPSSFLQILNKYIESIHHNLTIILKKELEIFMLEFSEKYFKNKTIPKFNPVGVYNSFNHKRQHHYHELIKLRQEIRSYMLIDKPWS